MYAYALDQTQRAEPRYAFPLGLATRDEARVIVTNFETGELLSRSPDRITLPAVRGELLTSATVAAYMRQQFDLDLANNRYHCTDIQTDQAQGLTIHYFSATISNNIASHLQGVWLDVEEAKAGVIPARPEDKSSLDQLPILRLQ